MGILNSVLKGPRPLESLPCSVSQVITILLRLDRAFVCKEVCSGYPGLWMYDCGNLVTSEWAMGNDWQKMEHLESLNPGELCKLSQPVPRKPKPGDGRGKIMRYPKDTFLLARGKGLELFPKIRTSQDVPRWAEPSRWTECFRERDWTYLTCWKSTPFPVMCSLLPSSVLSMRSCPSAESGYLTRRPSAITYSGFTDSRLAVRPPFPGLGGGQEAREQPPMLGREGWLLDLWSYLNWTFWILLLPQLGLKWWDVSCLYSPNLDPFNISRSWCILIKFRSRNLRGGTVGTLSQLRSF